IDQRKACFALRRNGVIAAFPFAPLYRGVRIIRQSMITSLLLALLVTLSGTVATYLYDENASFGARLCAGAALGLAALGLVGFVVASFIGLSGAAILFSAVICCSPLALLIDPKILKAFQQDTGTISTGTHQLVRFEFRAVGYFLFYAIVAVIFWK